MAGKFPFPPKEKSGKPMPPKSSGKPGAKKKKLASGKKLPPFMNLG